MNYKLLKNNKEQTDKRELSLLPVNPQWTLDEITKSEKLLTT